MYNHYRTTLEGDNTGTTRPRYTVSVDDDIFKRIEDFRFEHRFQTRSEATVELIRIGLDVVESRKKQQKETEEK